MSLNLTNEQTWSGIVQRTRRLCSDRSQRDHIGAVEGSSGFVSPLSD